MLGNKQYSLRKSICAWSTRQLFSLSNDGTEFGGSIYQKVNDELETAVTLAWTAGSNNTRFGIAAKYKLDKDASLSVSAPWLWSRQVLTNPLGCFVSFLLFTPQAKVNNASLIGVGYTQSLRPGRPNLHPTWWVHVVVLYLLMLYPAYVNSCRAISSLLVYLFIKHVHILPW